jgi:hypothetical protein
LRELDITEQRQAICHWWQALDRRELFLLNKLLTGLFRVRISNTLVVRAIAQMAWLQAAAVAHRLMGEWTPRPPSSNNRPPRRWWTTIAPGPIHFAWPTSLIIMSPPWGTGTTGRRNGKRRPYSAPATPRQAWGGARPRSVPHRKCSGGGATRAGGDDGGAPPGEAGDARDAGGCNGFGQGHLGEDRRQASGQPRCPRPGRPQE